MTMPTPVRIAQKIIKAERFYCAKLAKIFLQNLNIIIQSFDQIILHHVLKILSIVHHTIKSTVITH